MSQPQPSSYPPAPAPSRRPSWLVLVVVALVVGAAGVGLGLLLGGGEPDRAEADAKAACTIVGRLDADDPLPEEDAFDSPEFWETSAVFPLASAAAAGDEEYDDLAASAESIGQAVQTNDADRLSDGLRATAEECDALGLG